MARWGIFTIEPSSQVSCNQPSLTGKSLIIKSSRTFRPSNGWMDGWIDYISILVKSCTLTRNLLECALMVFFTLDAHLSSYLLALFTPATATSEAKRTRLSSYQSRLGPKGSRYDGHLFHLWAQTFESNLSSSSLRSSQQRVVGKLVAC